MTAYNLITDGLVAKWSASGYSSGTTWTDDIAGNTLTFTSAPTKGTDSITLTSSQTFTSNSLTSLGLSCPMTFEWLGTVDGSWSSSAPGNVFNIGPSSNTWKGCICCYSHSTYGIQLDLSSSHTIASYLTNTGIEYHIVITVNSSGTATLYVNSTTAVGTSSATPASANKLYLSNGEGSGRFSGSISRMCFWNKELSSTELNTLFSEATTAAYDVTINSTSGGTTTPTGTQSVTEGNNLTIKMIPDDGYYLSDITKDGVSVLSDTTEEQQQVTWTVDTNYSTYNTYTLSNAYDGDTTSYFWAGEAQASGKYVKINFSSAVTLNSFEVYSSNSTDYPASINELQVSSDGESWLSLGSFPGSQTSTFANLNATNVQYVRIYASGTATNWLVINEITMSYIAETGNQYIYLLSNITDDVTINITYAENTSVITHTVNGSIVNGTITSPTDLPVNIVDGKNVVFNFVGDEGYSFSSMTVNGNSVQPVETTVHTRPNTASLYHFDGSAADILGNSTMSMGGSAQLSSTNYKYGTGGLYLNGSSYLQINLAEDYSPVTVECWFYVTADNASGSYPTLFSTTSTTNAGGTYMHIDDGSYSTYPVCRSNSSSTNNGGYGTTVITRNEWHHFAYVRNGSSHYYFIDGTLQYTVTQASPNAISTLYFGALRGASTMVGSTYMTGYIDEIMVSTEAKWTANFTPPTQAYSTSTDSTYTYTITNIQEDTNVVIIFGEDIDWYLKKDNAWQPVVKIYKKINNTWTIYDYVHSDSDVLVYLGDI